MTDEAPKVVDIGTRFAQRAAATGARMFLVCGCEPADVIAGFAPAMIQDASGPFIAALVCLGCNAEISVVNGRPQR